MPTTWGVLARAACPPNPRFSPQPVATVFPVSRTLQMSNSSIQLFLAHFGPHKKKEWVTILELKPNYQNHLPKKHAIKLVRRVFPQNSPQDRENPLRHFWPVSGPGRPRNFFSPPRPQKIQQIVNCGHRRPNAKSTKVVQR